MVGRAVVPALSTRSRDPEQGSRDPLLSHVALSVALAVALFVNSLFATSLFATFSDEGRTARLLLRAVLLPRGGGAPVRPRRNVARRAHRQGPARGACQVASRSPGPRPGTVGTWVGATVGRGGTQKSGGSE